MLVNIVGFAIVNKNDQLQCLDLSNFIDISKESKDPLTSFFIPINVFVFGSYSYGIKELTLNILLILFCAIIKFDKVDIFIFVVSIIIFFGFNE